MKETPSHLLGNALLDAIREAVREEFHSIVRSHTNKTPEVVRRQYLTVKEAAAASGLGASTIRLHIGKRKLRAQKVGRRVLIKRSDLEAFLESQPIQVSRE